MKKWLCLEGKCIYAISEIKPIFEFFPAAKVNGLPTSFVKTLVREEIYVYCIKKHNFIKAVVTSCKDFQNSRLI